MCDNRFGTMRVIRTGRCPETVCGDEAIQTRPEGTGGQAPTGDAHAGQGCHASRSGTGVRSKPADDLAMGTDAGRRSDGVATPSTWTADLVRPGTANAVEQTAVARCGGQWISHRDVDAGPGRQADRAAVRPRIQHNAYLAGAARPR